MAKDTQARRSLEAGLADAPEFIHRPVAEYRLAVDITLIHRPKIAAVIGHRPVVAQHEIRVWRNRHFRIRPGIGIGRRNVVFVEGFAIHVDLAAVDANAVASEMHSL